MLEEQKLLNNVRRGRWVFVSAETFEADVQKVWGAACRAGSRLSEGEKEEEKGKGIKEVRFGFQENLTGMKTKSDLFDSCLV